MNYKVKWIGCVAVVVLLLAGAGCLSSPLQGGLLTYTNHHVYGKVQGNQLGAGRVEKKGESCSWSIIFIKEIFYGPGLSVSEAASQAQITKIAVVDRKSLSILPGFFYMECMEVWGE